MTNSFNEAPAKRGGILARCQLNKIAIYMASMRPPQNAGGFADPKATTPISRISFNEAPAKRGGILWLSL